MEEWLTSEEVAERERSGLTNGGVESPSKSVWQIIQGNIFTFFNLIFLIIAILLILVDSPRDLTFLPIVIANALIGIFQELRAKKVLDELKVLNSPKATVIRDGKEQVVRVEKLVMDDVILLKAGDQIPADAEIISGEVAVNESLLTGEPDEIIKKTGAELLSGSFVVYGNCRARLTKVGRESYAAKLTIRARAEKTGEQSEIMRSLNRYIKVVGVLIIPIGVLMFSQQYFFQGATAQNAVVAMVAAILGMIPEGLFLLSSVTLLISAMRLAREQVMLHEMKSIETLARVDTLCVDKTGTITSEKMKVVETTVEEIGVLKKFVKAAGVAENATMAAVAEFVKGTKIKKTTLGKSVKIFPFSSRYKYSGVEFTEKTLVMGAPEMVMREEFGSIQEECEKWSRKGYRVLVFGEYQGKIDESRKLTGEVKLLGLIMLENEIRKTAAETFRYFREQGVEVKVISGDNPATVGEVAKKVGIQHAGKMADASKVTDDEELEKIVMEKTVLGRVTPEQKRKIVKILQRAGRTVAMTGDGVNDVLALKDADCSVAMASGAQAAVQVAQVVLLESDFSKMPEVVAEGRRVVNNLERSGSLFVVKNIFSIIMAILSIMFMFSYPMLPTQVSLVTGWTIGVPSFLLAQIPNRKLIKGNFLRNIITVALPASITGVITLVAVVIIGKIFQLSAGEISTICTGCWGAIGLIHLARISRPFDILKSGIFAISTAGLLTCFIGLKRWFGIAELGMVGLEIMAGGILATGGIYIMLKRTLGKILSP
ncbi:MAG: HAD-IC family P-type ATPase [Candidatus Saccharibacteria bacterium]|nr:HAD-IC family P-type ATPase [Candidatus Saccharibacteria bacterium]